MPLLLEDVLLLPSLTDVLFFFSLFSLFSCSRCSSLCMSDWDNLMAANADCQNCDHFNIVSSLCPGSFRYHLSPDHWSCRMGWHLPLCWCVGCVFSNQSTPMTTNKCPPPKKNKLNICILPVFVLFRSNVFCFFAWLFDFPLFIARMDPIRYLLMDPISNTHRFNCIQCLLCTLLT